MDKFKYIPKTRLQKSNQQKSSYQRVLTAREIKSIIDRIARAILSRNKPPESIALIGIRRRGVPLAQRLQKAIEKISHISVPLGILDITLYRDDLNTIGVAPVVQATEISFPITDKNIILVDDVLFTGRTVRAALDAIIEFGRPRTIQLAVLIDRGLRELPIQADYLGKKLKTHPSQIVEVKLKETDGKDEVLLKEKK